MLNSSQYKRTTFLYLCSCLVDAFVNSHFSGVGFFAKCLSRKALTPVKAFFRGLVFNCRTFRSEHTPFYMQGSGRHFGCARVPGCLSPCTKTAIFRDSGHFEALPVTL